MMKKENRPPSRIKYENNNPTISARLPKEKHDRLLAILVVLKMTLTQLLLHFIGEYDPKVTPVEEARKQGLNEGWKRGVSWAREKYLFSAPCTRCGKEIILTDKESKDVVRNILRQNGWQHADCSDAD